jgi:hypothetical protein
MARRIASARSDVVELSMVTRASVILPSAA